MSADAYIGMGLALLGSNACLLLLVLNVLGWINFLHADLTAIEDFAGTTLPQWQGHFQTATVAWLVFTLIAAVLPAVTKDTTGEKKGVGDDKKKDHPWRRTALVIACVSATLALPHIMAPHRDRHPIIRRSLVGGASTSSVSTEQPGEAATGEQQRVVIQQELVFTVDNMTCGGCGGHVRNLVESALSSQQKSSPSSFAFDKVQVDWRAGVMSIYGTGLTDAVDRQAVAAVLEKDGYPTSFLYSQ